MTVLHVERLGGLPSIGTPRSPLRSCGEIALRDLSAADRAAIDDLFRNPPRAAPSALRDGFRYKLSRDGAAGPETIEVPESAVPPFIAASVKDTFV
jgi:hypothetical protein